MSSIEALVKGTIEEIYRSKFGIYLSRFHGAVLGEKLGETSLKNK